MSTIVGRFRKNIIKLLNLTIEDGTPIYIGEINRNHMKSRHPYEYDKYYEEITNILDCPDYVGINPHDNSVMYVKEFEEAGEHIRVGVKVSSGGTHFARTLHLLSSCNAEKYIEKGTLIRVDKS